MLIWRKLGNLDRYHVVDEVNQHTDYMDWSPLRYTSPEQPHPSQYWKCEAIMPNVQIYVQFLSHDKAGCVTKMR
jgi:hypothetical protein